MLSQLILTVCVYKLNGALGFNYTTAILLTPIAYSWSWSFKTKVKEGLGMRLQLAVQFNDAHFGCLLVQQPNFGRLVMSGVIL